MTPTAPAMNLPESAMPWGRSVESRIADVDVRIAQQFSSDNGDAASTRAAADSISEQLGELEKVIGISQYELAPFSAPYSGVPLGGTPIIVNTPTWNINVPSTVETISAIVNLEMSDSSGAGTGPRLGRALFRVGGFSSISQINSDSSIATYPRSMMATVPAVHPLQVSVGFQHSGTASGSLSGSGLLTLIFYGR